MDIQQTAAAAAAILAPYLAKVGEEFSKKIGEGAYKKLASLYEAIKSKFIADKDEFAQKTLERLEAQPTTESRQAALADVLVEKAQADGKFADNLGNLTKDAAADKTVNQFLTQVYGEGRVGKILNIGRARDIKA
jgi:hypothetical protein